MRRPRVVALAALFLIALSAVARPRSAVADVQRAWIKAVPDEATWKKYSKTLGADEFGKFVIDLKSNEIYFFDVNLFELHADFVLGVLLKQPWTRDNIIAYNKNYERVKPKFILGYLTHHTKVDRWALSFWEGDQIDAPTVLKVRDRLKGTFWRTDLAFRPDSPQQEKMAKGVAAKGFTVVTNDEFYKAAAFQAFNKGKAIGRLKVVPVGTPYDQLTFDRHDIVLLQESYPDISPVAGILSTTFSTPLSHVNLRAGSWGIPNAGYKRAREEFGGLDGKLVYYAVEDAGAVVREATPAEIAAWEQVKAQARHVALPRRPRRSAAADVDRDPGPRRGALRHQDRQPRRDPHRQLAQRPDPGRLRRAVLLLRPPPAPARPRRPDRGDARRSAVRRAGLAADHPRGAARRDRRRAAGA
jgi:hypothetical protein